MFKKLIFYFLSFSIVSFALISSFAVLKAKKPAPVTEVNPYEIKNKPADYSSVFASLPDNKINIITSVKTADSRAEILRQYLKKYESPLEPYANLIVYLADQYDFDYRWLVAIAQQESNLCKKIPENSYNCWGWGIYPDPENPEVLKVTRFSSYDDALTRIAPQFKDIFLSEAHHKDPFTVMKTYTPPSDGSWARAVKQFFSELE